MALEIEKVIVSETMREDAIGQWIKPKRFNLTIVPIYVPVFKFCLNIAVGTFKEYKRYLLTQFECTIEHEDAKAMANSFKHEGTEWHFINLESSTFKADDYGTIVHELHHATHFMLEERGITYGTAGEEVYAYVQGHLMELLIRALVMLDKKKRPRLHKK